MKQTTIKQCAECGNEQGAIKGSHNSSVCRKCGSRNMWLKQWMLKHTKNIN